MEDQQEKDILTIIHELKKVAERLDRIEALLRPSIYEGNSDPAGSQTTCY